MTNPIASAADALEEAAKVFDEDVIEQAKRVGVLPSHESPAHWQGRVRRAAIRALKDRIPAAPEAGGGEEGRKAGFYWVRRDAEYTRWEPAEWVGDGWQCVGSNVANWSDTDLEEIGPPLTALSTPPASEAVGEVENIRDAALAEAHDAAIKAAAWCKEKAFAPNREGSSVPLINQGIGANRVASAIDALRFPEKHASMKAAFEATLKGARNG